MLINNDLYTSSLVRPTPPQETVTWIINNQLGRRNLTPELASWLRGQRYHREKGREGGGHPANLENQGWPTAQRLADECKVSPSTIEADAS
jgi:hypothetical protein